MGGGVGGGVLGSTGGADGAEDGNGICTVGLDGDEGVAESVESEFCFGSFFENEVYPIYPPMPRITRTMAPIITGAIERFGMSSSKSSSSDSKRS